VRDRAAVVRFLIAPPGRLRRVEGLDDARALPGVELAYAYPATGTLKSEQGWSAPLYMHDGIMWYAKRDVPIAVVTSLLVQGAFCYLIEYFAANYFLNSGYSMASASGSAAPIGDMMVVVGNHLFNGHGRAFMLIEAFTVFLAIIGTTLSCMNTGARVTYAMGKDKEMPDSMGALHAANLTPHRAIWTLALISAVVGSLAVVMAFGDAGAPADTAIQALPHGFWSSFGCTTPKRSLATRSTLRWLAPDTCRTDCAASTPRLARRLSNSHTRRRVSVGAAAMPRPTM
jgi:hypothetical protein